MNRKLFIQVTAPAVVVGLVLLGTCLGSAWYLHRLQANLASILSENVTSQGAAQELEIRVRQLRFHSFLYLVDPSPVRRERIGQDHERFEDALVLAKNSANTPDESLCVKRIETAYRHYREEMDQLLAAPPQSMTRAELARLIDAHPLQQVVDPAQELLRVNKEQMEQSAEESQRVARQAQFMMMLIGIVGPVSGLIIGYGIVRGLSRSIYQLSVRVRDMAQRLDQDVVSVSIEADGDLNRLDRQLQHVVQRVEEVADRQRRHQHDMLRAEQLAAVGQLAASVAHEVRNPLTSVKMLVELALRKQNPKPLTEKDLEVIGREITRLEHTVQGFLDFARLPQPKRAACDIREVIANAVELVRARARQQRVEICVRSSNEPVILEIDREQLGTVLVNLLINALDAMPDGGRMEVSLEIGLGSILILVADSGAGISDGMLPRLFSPFASSKETGTGLGLSLSRRIVEEHGGTISGANRDSGGAEFMIRLPTKPSASVPAAPNDMHLGPNGRPAAQPKSIVFHANSPRDR